jgi:FeS assembly protein IscX
LRSGFNCRRSTRTLTHTVRFTDLHRYVTELPGFVGDRSKSTEGLLEAIQTAWHEEYEDARNA